MTLMGRNPNTADEIRAVSLFSGLGGLDIGLHQAGVQTLVCVERDDAAAQTLKINSGRHDAVPPEPHVSVPARYPWKVLHRDIRDVTAADILEEARVGRSEIDLVVGGPPCQTFSRSNEGNRDGIDAERGKLFEEYARVLHALQPNAFIFENVRGLESSNDGSDLREIRKQLEGDIYQTEYRVLNAADYGVPQTRKRIIMLGAKDHRTEFPDPTHSENGENGKLEWVTVGEALSEFNVDRGVEKKGGYQNAIGSRYGHLLKEIPEGANYQHFSERKYDPERSEYVDREETEMEEKHFRWRSRHWNYLLKMDRDRPSWTLQAAPGSTVGPFHWRARKLSLLEQMKLMDIPLDYYVAGQPGQIQKQIGNAVPPVLAKAVARHLVTSLGLTLEGPENPGSNARTSRDTSTSGQPPFTVEVTTERSPWLYADRLIHALIAKDAVVVEAVASAIPIAIDAIEIARRQISKELKVDFEESVKEGEEWKGGCASVLRAKVLSEKASVNVAEPIAAS